MSALVTLAPCWQRMGCAEGAHGGARVRAVLDLSNRPHFESNLPLDEENVGAIEYGKCVCLGFHCSVPSTSRTEVPDAMCARLPGRT